MWSSDLYSLSTVAKHNVVVFLLNVYISNINLHFHSHNDIWYNVNWTFYNRIHFSSSFMVFSTLIVNIQYQNLTSVIKYLDIVHFWVFKVKNLTLDLYVQYL